MPPAKPLIDALWHCLCPSYKCRSHRVLKPFLQATLRVATQEPLRTVWPAVPVVNNRVQSSRFSQTHSHGTIKQQKRLKLVETVNAFPPESKQQPEEQSKQVSKSYDDLFHAGADGNFTQVQEIVRVMILDRGERPNSRHYRALLLANSNAEHGSAENVRVLLEEMREEGIEKDIHTYHAALKALAIHPDYVLRSEILENLRNRWFTLTNEGWHDVIAGCIRDRQVEISLDKLQQMQRAGLRVASWLHDLFIYTFCDTGDFDEVLEILRFRAYESDRPASGTLWCYVLDAASRAMNHEATLYVWQQRVERGYLNPPTGVCDNVLNTAARHGNFKLATDVFRVLGKRSNTFQTHHYEALLESYITASELKTALKVLSIMSASKIKVTEASARPLFLCLRGDPTLTQKAMKEIHRLVQIDHDEIPTPVVNAVIEAFVHQQDLASSIETYKVLHTLCPTGPNTATFNVLFRGCSRAQRKDLAMFLAAEMLALKVSPDALTYDRLLLVCLEGDSDQDYEDAWRYFGEMKELGWFPRRGTLVVMVKRSAEMGDGRIWGLVEEMERREMDVAGIQKWVGHHWRALKEASRMRRDSPPARQQVVAA